MANQEDNTAIGFNILDSFLNVISMEVKLA